MNWLQAALAFALIMLVLATVVTMILETGYKLLSTREKGFRLMMERLFDDVLRPRIAHLLNGTTMEQARAQFLDVVTHSQAYAEKPGPLRALAQSGELSSMTMMQFADRIADTHAGKAIARGGMEHINAAINDLAQKFERFGQASSRRFQDHARFWCLLVSLLLAFVINFDAVRVFQELLHNDALTSGIIARYGNSVQDGALRPQDIAAPRVELAKLQDTGLPMTIEYWPFCTATQPADRKCRSTDTDTAITATLWKWNDIKGVLGRIATTQGLAWFLSVVFAGFLIGLGSPFWFDLARGLTRSAQLMGAAGIGEKNNKAAEPAPVTDASASPPPRTPVEAFKVAIAAAAPVPARALLSPSGKPVRGVA